MRGRERCNEILRLIDEALADLAVLPVVEVVPAGRRDRITRRARS